MLRPPPVLSEETQKPKMKRTAKAPELHTQGDSLHDEPHHVALCLATLALVCANAAHVVIAVMASQASLGSAALAAVAGYVFADFGTGVYHWAVDNYGSGSTPIVGYQIAAFQGHHKSPWTITERDTFNNLHRACVPVLPVLTILVALGDAVPDTVRSFLTIFLAAVVGCQEIHKWSHMVAPPKAVVLLQKAGLLLSRRDHGQHHLSPFEGKYCIVNGWCNGFLDRVEFFRRLEVFFYRKNGSEPIAWKLDPELKRSALEKFSR